MDVPVRCCRRYYHEHGNLNVPSEYVTPDGVLLGKWVARQRYAYLNPDRSSARVTPERKALLDELGMVWEKYDPWQERYNLALATRQSTAIWRFPLSTRPPTVFGWAAGSAASGRP